MRFKGVKTLEKGDIVANKVFDVKGRILINQNVTLTSYLIKRLKEEKIEGIYVYDKLSKGITPQANISLELQIQAAESVRTLNIDECMYVSGEIAKSLTNIESIYTNVNALMGFDMCTYMHSTNVAIYAGTLGMMLGMPLEKVKNLIAAALLHDIGKMQISKEIIDSTGKLSKEEFEEIKKHPKLGYDALKDLESVPSVVRVSVLEHHENYNGSGYPNQLSDDETYEFAKIIHICDVYDAMLSKRSYKDTLNPADVIEHIMANSSVMFNPEYVRAFLKSLIPYPEGVGVLLSDGNHGIVSKINKDFLLRPIVRLKDGKEIDMSKKLDLTIVGISL